MKLLLSRVLDNNLEVVTKSLQCLIDYAKIYYDTLEENLKEIWENISQYIGSDTAEVAIPAMEVFNAIALEDKERANESDKSMAFG